MRISDDKLGLNAQAVVCLYDALMKIGVIKHTFKRVLFNHTDQFKQLAKGSSPSQSINADLRNQHYDFFLERKIQATMATKIIPTIIGINILGDCYFFFDLNKVR